jgi:hypothetical protein
VCALGAVFVAGLLPGLFAQAEIAEPGLQIVGDGGERSFDLAVMVHTLVYGGMMPLAGIALALAVIAEVRNLRIARIASILALAAAALLPVALSVMTSQRFAMPAPGLRYFVYAPDMLMLAQAALGLAVAILLAVFARQRRAAAIIFASLSGVAILLAADLEFILIHAGDQTALHDTYFNTAAHHAAGVAIALNILGALTVWSIRWEGHRRTWFSLGAGIATLAAGITAASAAAGLGLMGMPRRYVDYASAFGQNQAIFALWSFAFAAVLVAAIIWLAIIVWRTKRPPGVETTFD